MPKVNEIKAHHREQQVQEAPVKAYPVNGDKDEEHKQRNGEIYRLRYALRNEEIVLGHGYLAIYLSVIVKNAHGASCGCGEIVEQQQSADRYIV